MKEDYKRALAGKIEKNFSELEERILEDIVRRIKQYGKITSTADWQINRLVALGHSSEDIEKMLKEALDASWPEMFELYDQVIDWEYVRNKDIYEQLNADFIQYEDNEQLKQLVESLINQTKGDLENITQSLGFYLDYGNGKRVFTPLAQIYQQYLDDAIFDIASGAFDYNSTIRKVVTQLTNSGLRSVDYASGRSYRVNVAARTAIMTGISQLSGQISDLNASKLGTEYFEVAWHSGARPEHAEWQGKVWTKRQLSTVCGLGTVTGLLGANCYHEYYPFFPGLSERNWSDEWLEKQNQKENTPKEWKGKEYTTYEAKQKQRQMETVMRAQRQKVNLLQNGDADPDDVMLARCKYQAQLNEYSRFSKKMGLKQERERIYYDIQGRVATNTKKQNAKYSAEMIKNASRDSKQYARYKSIIGDSVGTLAEFRQMKYNDSEKFNLLSDYTNSVKNGMISMLSGFENYKELHSKVKNEIIGTKTVDGITITGQSKHFLERVIGTMQDPKTNRPRSGVNIEDIKEALLKGTVRTSARDPNSVKYVTDKCIVSLNPQTGNLIQCNPQ